MVNEADSFASAAALRDANRPLLDELPALDQDDLPDEFLAAIDRFRRRAAATGEVMATVEDRAEAQAAINFWTTVLYSGGRRPESVLLAQFDSEAARERAGDAPPYKGLESFQAEDNERFFGRHEAVTAMLDKLKATRLLAVVGLSGSGKSSAVRAGLIPQLRDGAAEGSKDWLILDPLVPDTRPIDALKRIAREVDPDGAEIAAPADFVAALDRAGRPVMVSVDQFEELFTLTDSKEDRVFFAEALADAATLGKYRHVVLLTMRSEYDSHVTAHPRLAQLFEAGRVQLGALSAQDLHAAIEQPAEQAGGHFETGLAEELVQQVLGEPAGLPLLQFTLLELWKQRAATNLLTWEAYRDLGGSPRKILAERANSVYEKLLPEDQVLTRKMFVKLVEIGDGLVATSRRMPRYKLVGPRDNVDFVLSRWQQNGLIRISPEGPIGPESQIEVAHESLLRNWSLLGRWIEDAFASTRRHRALEEIARAWRANPQRTDLLLGEISLREVDQLGDLDEDYVDASRVEVARAKRRLLRQKQFGLAAVVVGILLLLWSGVSTTLAVRRANYAEASELRARASALYAARQRVQAARAQHDFNELMTKLNGLRTQHALIAGQFRNAQTSLARVRSQAALVQSNTVAWQGRLAAVKFQAGIIVRNALADLDSARRTASQVFSAVQRPVLEVRDGRLADVPPAWPRLGERRATVEAAARSVGVLRGAVHPGFPYRGTAFMVADGVAATMRHSISDDGVVEGMTIDFRDRPDDDERYGFPIEAVIGEIPSPIQGGTFVLMRVARQNRAGQTLPPPLPVAEVDPQAPTTDTAVFAPQPLRELYLIGYPSYDPRQAEEVNRALLGNNPGVKRVQPGLLMFDRANGDDLQLYYDNSTFGGNGGSPIIDLGTGRVVGIHHSGAVGVIRFGTAFTRAVLSSPAARAAGLTVVAADSR